MSLVGPRPPIPYEVEEYVTWYTGRFDAVPGMTGLWQVSGKNRLTFKDMARLDIRYARQMSFALDLKILLLTPLAIFYQIKDILRKKQPLAKGVGSA
jgi:Sugar transferases involved in lipopolysaccharide synthesis